MVSMRQTGPFLRADEGGEGPVLCNYEDMDLDGDTETDTSTKEYEHVEMLESEDNESEKREDTQDELSGGEDEGPAQDTQVVYQRERVFVWPSKNRSIEGRVSLVKQGSAIFFSWLPCLSLRPSGDLPTFDDAGIDLADIPSTPLPQGQYAVHPIPLSDMKSLRKQTPVVGTHHIILVLKNGLTLPPFHFRDGGVKTLLSVIKQYAAVTKSTQDPSSFLINDVEDPLQKSLAAMDLSDALMMGPAQLAQLPQPQNKDAQEPEGFLGRVREGYQRATQFATSSFISLQSGIATPQSNVKEMLAAQEKEFTDVGLFELLDRTESESLAGSSSHPRAPPLTQDEYFTYFDTAGSLMNANTLKTRIFRAGVEPKVRKEAWKFLLGMYPKGSTAAYRQSLLAKRCQEYKHLKAQWTSITEKQAAKFGKWRDRKMRVDKDINRTDCGHSYYRNPKNVDTLRSILLTYSMYNFDLGYCQGMSDLASPILYVMRDEALAFWCFANLMERMECNFSTDCVGMHTQLEALKSLVKLCDPELHSHFEKNDCLNYFFCYRWLLVLFKREFSFEQGLRLWEALWSCPFTEHFHIYMCAAVLRLHRQAILSESMSFDELLSYCILLSGKLDLAQTMRVAEKILKSTGEQGVQCLKAIKPVSL